jgi:hypothetical protein
MAAPMPPKGGVDFLGGRLWIQRAAPDGKKAPAPPPAKPAELVALAPAVEAGKPPFPDWCSDGALREAAALKAGMPQMAAGGFQAWAGFTDEKGKPLVPGWAAQIAVVLPFGLDSLVITIARAPFRVVDWLLKWLPTSAQCSIASARTIGLWSFAVGWLNWITQDGFKPIRRAIHYQMDYNCPSECISGDDAVQLTLRQRLDYNEGEGWAAANGWCPPTFQQRYWLAQRRLDEHELIEQLHRQTITRDECIKKLIARGVADEATASAIIELSWQLLPVNDIFEGLHRLRPGRDPSGITYTRADAERDLGKHGYQQREIGIMIALSYATVTHRRLLSPYEHGKISWEDFAEYMRDDRTTDRAMETLRPFFDFERSRVMASEVGIPQPAALVKSVAAGDIPVSQLQRDMQQSGYNGGEMQRALQAAQDQRASDLRAACISQVRGALRTGASSPEEAAIALSQCGVDQAEARQVVELWALERATGAKPATAAQLCDWVGRGWMSVLEYEQRLRMLGYSVQDIARIKETCGLKLRAAQEKRRATAAKATAAEIRHRIEQSRLAKSVAGDVARREKAAAKAESAAAKAAAKTAASVVSGAVSQSATTGAPYTAPTYAPTYPAGTPSAQPPSMPAPEPSYPAQPPPPTDTGTPAADTSVAAAPLDATLAPGASADAAALEGG